MATDADPYRTLGLTRDATLEEVRRAYRRLAKANHPDAAGEAALPRFLAIQAAYDQIAGPGARGRRPGPARPAAPRRAWDAERERTDATYRAYGGRPRRPRPSPSGGPGGPNATGGPGAARGPAAERPPGASRPPRPERPPNRATLGSTSYDGADAEPFEPDWGGASWYGNTSGTYWTLNPKEYADPRKHGPEYQARARRKLRGREETDGFEAEAAPEAAEPGPDRADAAQTPAAQTPASQTEDPAGAAADAPAGAPAGSPPRRRDARTTPPPSHTTSSWWEATAGHPSRPDAAASSRTRQGERPNRPAAASTADTATPGMSADAILDAVRAWLDDTHPGAIGRIARAVVGWAPIALGIGWLSGEMSGCGRFAAGCNETATMSAWVAQIGVLVFLLVVGRLARIASVATLATLAAAVPAALLLTATGSPDDAAAGRTLLSGLLLIAWVVGLGFGVLRAVRGVGRRAAPPAPPGVSGSAGPVS